MFLFFVFVGGGVFKCKNGDGLCCVFVTVVQILCSGRGQSRVVKHIAVTA